MNSSVDLSGLFKDADNVQTLEAGHTIFDEGWPGDVAYILLEGEVRLSVGGELLEKLRPGEIFGELALIDSGPRSASARAATACKVASFDEKQFLFMVQQTPFFALQVMRILSERLRRMNARV